MPYHLNCWEENQGCAQYGCKSAPATAKSSSPVAPAHNWNEYKKCPACGAEIKTSALKCRFCQAQFGTRDQLSRAQFQVREYEGRELAKKRNQVIAIFLASGVLAPVTFFLLLRLLFVFSPENGGQRVWGISFLRLPPVLKALSWFAFGISCLWFLLFLFVILFD